MLECFFCQNSGGQILYQCQLYRIILIADGAYPGYLRIVLNSHIKELTDLSDADNSKLYQAVMRSEKILRQLLQPDKINLTSFGNLTPHVHWHLIPRFSNDRHFPNPSWGEITHPEYIPAPHLQQAAAELVYNFESLFLA